MGITDHIGRLLKQRAVYWGSPTPDGYGGYAWATPVEVNCRWQEGVKVVVTSDGKEVISTAQVWVDRDMSEGDMLWLGSLSSLTSAQQADPTTLQDAYTVKRVEKTPELGKSGNYLRKVYL